LFELGRCFEGSEADVACQPERIAALAYGARWPEQWGEKSVAVDFYDAKGDLEALAAGHELVFVSGAHPACHPGRCAAVALAGRPIGIIGELHPRLAQKYELSGPAVVFEVLLEPLLEGGFPRFR